MLNLGSFDWTGATGSTGTGSSGDLASFVKGAQGVAQSKNLGALAAPLMAVLGVPAVGVVLAALGIFVKGKTERISGDKAHVLARQYTAAIFPRIMELATPDQEAFLAEHLPGKVIDYIRSQIWWKERSVDNLNEANDFYNQLRTTPGGSDPSNKLRIELSILRLVSWAAKNSPADLTYFQPHVQQILSAVVGPEMREAYDVFPGGTKDPNFSGPVATAGTGTPSTAVKWLGTLAAIGTVIAVVKGVK